MMACLEDARVCQPAVPVPATPELVVVFMFRAGSGEALASAAAEGFPDTGAAIVAWTPDVRSHGLGGDAIFGVPV